MFRLRHGHKRTKHGSGFRRAGLVTISTDTKVDLVYAAGPQYCLQLPAALRLTAVKLFMLKPGGSALVASLQSFTHR
jgi:hypothetical protein